ncbi:MAG TPA: asparagine synthase (glutamine-hydrolyzing) [Blastocatellia bacterium]|nr:asparagine synthase (glutamine-hydrolyzing) [Blastocatellia bacterium]
MCGIAGIADSNGRPIEESVLRQMCDAMYHRGPDGDGFYFDHQSVGNPGSVGLGMRRLAIVDLVTGQQPIHNEDKTVWVVLNGEIYNYPDLRSELEARGHSFYTRSDTEAIVHVYEEFGLDAPKHLRGMFAFALWDTRKRLLLIARDRVGKKPLLYSCLGGRLAFASEFQSLLKHPDISREVNRQAIWDYLSFMCVPGPETAFAGIKKLDPGSRLVWQSGVIKIDHYWSLDFSRKAAMSEAEARERLLQLLRDAVKVRLMSDVPLGAFLSGGIDSSAVVAMMAGLSTRVKTFSIGFDERDFSEIEHARRVANHFGTDHSEFVVRPSAIEVLPTLVRHYGEPYADSSAVPTYYLSKVTRQHVTVALNGDGGDECFGGYERYAAMRIADSYRRLPRLLREGVVEPVVKTLPDPAVSRSRATRARRFFDVAGRPRPERYLRWTSAISEELKAEICTSDFLRSVNSAGTLKYVGRWFEGNGSVDIIDRVLKADTECYLPNDLLVKVDIASMAASLEARSPFLDHHLMEFAAGLPSNYKVRGLTTKYLLKNALRGILPETNLKRGKMGFGVPIGYWLRGELKDFLAGAILSERALGRGYFKPDAVRRVFDLHQAEVRDYAHQLWTLLMLELWHREFID